MTSRHCLPRLFVWMLALLIAALFAPLPRITSAVEAQTATTQALGGPPVRAISFRGDVRDLPQVPPTPQEEPELQEPTPTLFRTTLPGAPSVETQAPTAPLAAMPNPIQSFDGLSYTDLCPPINGTQCGHGHPPDPDGDVGLNYYISQINSAVAIYSKTGTLLASFTENSLFSGTGSNQCNGHSFGDPQTVYDVMTDRWILSWFAFTLVNGNQVAPIYQCFAVSMTRDPVAGGWWLYALRTDNISGGPPSAALGDYPKLGLWTDCLYMGANVFDSSLSFIGTTYWSFSRMDMEHGAPLTFALFYDSNINEIFTPIPATLHGNSPSSLPPPGTPEYFVSESSTAFALDVRVFTAGTDCGPTGASLSGETAHQVSQTGYNLPCFGTGSNCNFSYVPQPGTSTRLDTVGDRLKQKVQYRRLVGTLPSGYSGEELWVTHDVCRTGTTGAQCSTTGTTTIGIQWAEINVTNGTIASSPVQQQKFAPDTSLHRWMSSLAVDNAGNVALGYSRGNGTSPNYPGIYYAGRLVGDALNTLGQSETQLVAGSASQIFNCGGAPCHRWGDYTEMEVDPVDDCTFWYNNMYYSSTSNGNTGNDTIRLGSFTFPQPTNCTPSPVAQTNHTINFDGGVGSDWNAANERLGTMPQDVISPTFDYYETWDANNLYVGIKGNAPDVYTYTVVVDTDVSNDTLSNVGATGALVCAGGFNSNGKGDYALVKVGQTQTMTSTTNATLKYQNSGGSWVSTWAPSANTDAQDWGMNMAEFQFAFSDLGLAGTNNKIGVYIYVCDGANLVSAWPPENLQSGNPTLQAETVIDTNDAGRTPRTYAQRSGDEQLSITNGAGPFEFLDGYVSLANVNGLSSVCSFDARVLGNSDTGDPNIIRRVYTLTPGAGCTGLTADVTLQYEDGTADDNAPDELNGFDENTMALVRQTNGIWFNVGGTRDTANNTMTKTGVSEFSPWSFGRGAAANFLPLIVLP